MSKRPAASPEMRGLNQCRYRAEKGKEAQKNYLRNPMDRWKWIWLDANMFQTTCDRVTSVQLSSVSQSCPTLCNPMDYTMPGFPVLHQLPELAQTHVHRVSDAIQPSRPLSYPSPAFNLSQHQGPQDPVFLIASPSHQEVCTSLLS